MKRILRLVLVSLWILLPDAAFAARIPVPPNITQGGQILPSDILSLYTLVNGNLDNTNFSSLSNITGSQLSNPFTWPSTYTLHYPDGSAWTSTGLVYGSGSSLSFPDGSAWNSSGLTFPSGKTVTSNGTFSNTGTITSTTPITAAPATTTGQLVTRAQVLNSFSPALLNSSNSTSSVIHLTTSTLTAPSNGYFYISASATSSLNFSSTVPTLTSTLAGGTQVIIGGSATYTESARMVLPATTGQTTTIEWSVTPSGTTAATYSMLTVLFIPTP